MPAQLAEVIHSNTLRAFHTGVERGRTAELARITQVVEEFTANTDYPEVQSAFEWFLDVITNTDKDK